MADGLPVTPGSGATVGAELIGGQYIQRIKIATGGLDTDGGDVTGANPLPVAQQGTAIVACGTAGNFLVTATQSSSVTVISGTAANLLAQVSGTVTVGGTVTANCGTAANLLATVTQSSSVTVISATAANLKSQIGGALTHNNAAPGATQVGVIPAIANAAAQTWIEGDQVLLSTDLAGNLRTNATFSGVAVVSCGTAANLLAQVSQGTAANLKAQVNGGLTNNNAAPGATNVGALVGIANAAAVTYTEGDQVLLSTDLAGNLRTAATFSGSTITVLSGTAANLLSQVSGTVTAVSGTAANLLAQVSGTVTANCGTASALLTQVSQGTAGNLLATVNCGTAANMLTTSTVSCGTAANLLSQVSQGTATNLLAQVSQGTASNLLTTALLTPGTAMAGQMIAAPQISAYNGTASLTISYASISFTSSAGNSVISAVANKNIYILGGLVIANAATNVQFWQNTTASTALTGVLCLAANAGFQLPMGPWPNFATTSTNQAVQLSSSVATTIGGWLTYVAF